MRPAWRLATNSLSARRSRSALLVSAVALSAALIVAVACILASINDSISLRLSTTVGHADVTITRSGGGEVDQSVLDIARAWPEVESADGSLQRSMALFVKAGVWTLGSDGLYRLGERRLGALAVGHGVVGDLPVALIEGRVPAGPDEIVVDQALLKRLTSPRRVRTEAGDARQDGTGQALTADEAARRNAELVLHVGDRITYTRLLARARELEVVGIAEQPPLGGRPQCYMTIDALQQLTGQVGKYTEIGIVLKPDVDAEAFAARRRGELAPGLLMQTTARITSGLDSNMQSTELGLVLGTVMSFLSAAFIIVTGLTTNVAQRQRELAILRCIGATRRVLGAAQIIVGLLVGGFGALVGVPLGIGLAWLLAVSLGDDLPAGLVVPGHAVVLAVVGSLSAGALGALWPAWRAARTAPLRGLATYAHGPSVRGLVITGVVGLACLALMAVIVAGPSDGQVVFWGYATVGLPAMYVGYFLLGVPVTLLVVGLFGPMISRVLGLPRRVLARTVAATPYRHGFIAGAMMGGLALMVAIWTNGQAFMRDWLDLIAFPDAFVSGPSLPPEAQRVIDDLPFVERTCAVSLLPVQVDVFGVRALQEYATTFVAFEPDAYFAMGKLAWIEGDPEVAKARLREGGAVLVAREFQVARGMGVGDTFTCTYDDKPFSFEIVGVVTSPGLEVVSKFFNVGEELSQQAVHAVFGSRQDLQDKFASDSIQLIQIDLDDKTDGDVAIDEILQATLDKGIVGILDIGTGAQIKRDIQFFVRGMLLVFSVIALAAMLVACFGVANLIVAGIDARQFEFGVLRAVGAPHGLLIRLVMGEVVVIALTGCVLGTLMGIQGSWAGQVLDALLLGIEMRMRPAAGPIAIGWVILFVMTLGAAAPAMWRLGRKKPLDLLGADGG